LPPTAGESVKKRGQKNKFSTGSIFTQGYSVDYLYGEIPFMEDFFTGNGYKIIDKKTATF
jgi:hypothetical protein